MTNYTMRPGSWERGQNKLNDGILVVSAQKRIKQVKSHTPDLTLSWAHSKLGLR